MGLFDSFFKPNVIKLREKENIKGLVKALSYPKDSDVRRDAALALGEIGHSEVVLPLINALSDGEDSVREAVVGVLGRLGDHRAAKPLVDAMKDSTIRELAANALVSIGKPAVAPLIDVLNGDDFNIHKLAVTTLADIDDEDVRITVTEFFGTIDNHRVVEALMPMLTDDIPNVRQKAVNLLAIFKNSSSVDALERVLSMDISFDVRKAAAKALGKIGVPETVGALIGALADNDFPVRESAVEALVAIGSLAVEGSVGALAHETPSVREKATEVLGRIGDLRAIQPLLITVRNDLAVSVRRAAAKALGGMGVPETVGALIEALEDRNSVIQDAAVGALVAIGRPAVEGLIRVLKHETWSVREKATEALGKIADVRAMEPLLVLLKDDLAVVRKSSVQAVASLRDYRAVDSLIDVALHDRDPDIRNVATDAVISLERVTMDYLEADRPLREAAAISLQEIRRIIECEEKKKAEARAKGEAEKARRRAEEVRITKAETKGMEEQKRLLRQEEKRKISHCRECGAQLMNPYEYIEKQGLHGMKSTRGSVIDAFEMMAGGGAGGSAGFECIVCGATYCMPCMMRKAKPHRSGSGKGCLNCGGKMEIL